jgi:cell division protein FtsL
MGKVTLKRALFIGAGVLIAVLVIGVYKAKTDAQKTEARVHELQAQVEETEADLRALRAEIAHLESPERIEQLAEQHLGVTPGGESAALPEEALNTLPPPRREAGDE